MRTSSIASYGGDNEENENLLDCNKWTMTSNVSMDKLLEEGERDNNLFNIRDSIHDDVEVSDIIQCALTHPQMQTWHTANPNYSLCL